jgi:hypothetical protein
VLVAVALVVLVSFGCAEAGALGLGGAVCELASFLGQLQCRTLPLVEALRIGPSTWASAMPAECGDGVTRTPESYGARRVHDRDSCVRLAGRFTGPGERALEASFAITGLLGC